MSRRSRSVSRAAVFSVGLLCCGGLGSARAAPPPRLLLIDHGSPALARQLRAEGAYAGLSFEAPELTPEHEPDAELLAHSGAAALLIVSSDERLELRVVDPRARGAEPVHLQRGNEGESFALRAIEQLRARLVDVGWALPGSAAPQDVPSVAPRAPTPGVSRDVAAHFSDTNTPALESKRHAWSWWLNGGLAALDAAGGIGISWNGLLGLQFEGAGGWTVGALALLPLQDEEIHAAEGEADVSVHVYLLQLGYSRPFAPAWRWSAALGPGLLLLPLEAEGRAPWQGRKDHLLSGLGSVELGVSREIGGWLRLHAGALAGLCAPRPVLSFAGREAASWGRWFGGLSLRGELALPHGEAPE